MKSYLIYIIPILLFVSCNKEELIAPDASDAVELEGVTAVIDGTMSTRAAALDAYNYVGRSAFIDKDLMELTTIKRTVNAINGFTYKDIVYEQKVGAGQTAGGWNRVPEKGCCKISDTEWGTTPPERIYWSDAARGHTYIGFSEPQQPGGKTFDWVVRDATYEGSGSDGIPVYYGSIGDPKDSSNPTIIDYTNDANEKPVLDDESKPNGSKSYKTGNDKIKLDDILLTYDINKVAETGGSVAKLYFYHGLAMVRVVVKIQGFSASTDAADSKSVVKDMVLKDMLTMYKWKQMSHDTEALDEAYDKVNINNIYNNGTDGPVTCDQKKDVQMWIPRPGGTGTGVGKQFTFYALAVPRVMGVDNAVTDEDKAKNLHFEFKVKYPDPMNPSVDVEKTYKAMMDKRIEFRAGYCTTINITLNHSNEEMTIGAEYMDWQMIESPDEGELKKNSTFLKAAPALADRGTINVTIAGDREATVDDATWLYGRKVTDPDTNVEVDEILDIYGNDGSATKPYTISTANQLLSFAYEVKNGRDFKHKFVKLDADIVLQPSLNVTADNRVTWIGIGDAEHKFNGFFLGSERHINSLYGEHFFHTVGDNAVIDKLNFDDVIEVLGCGVVAHKNEGLICSCYIDGDIMETNTETQYTGSIVGENQSFIIACSHVGKVSGYNIVGGLVGFNNGTVMASYHSGEIVGLNDGAELHATVGICGNGENYTNKSIMFSCYYDENKISHTPTTLVPGKSGYPLPTAMMQSNAFVRDGKDAPSFIYDKIDDETEKYTGQGPKLRIIAENLVRKNHGVNSGKEPKYTDEQIQTMTDLQLIDIILPADAMSEDVYEMFENHFSLNTALRVFKYWITRVHTNMADKPETTTIETNCHTFTKAQIEFLNNHYTNEHRFNYTPASYPKVQ
ncbi:MAG: hypothetical protein KBT33_00295 [Prevotellaceae bacterium]|nr:hypothetical protein [Candidatus Minthosoma equi]